MRVRLMLVITLALATSACGWQLRGSVALSSLTDSLYLTGNDNYGLLMTELRNRLEAESLTLTESQSGAQYTLRIREETLERRIAAVGSDALASAYELTLSAQFDVLDHRGLPLAGDLRSRVVRSYTAGSGNVGSGNQEEALLISEMRSELSQQVLRQLQAVISAGQARGASSTPATDQVEAPDGKTAP